jgi:hypothetical protein
MTQSTTLRMTVPYWVLGEIKRLALADHRTQSQMAKVLLIEPLEARAKAKPPTESRK